MWVRGLHPLSNPYYFVTLSQNVKQEGVFDWIVAACDISGGDVEETGKYEGI